MEVYVVLDDERRPYGVFSSHGIAQDTVREELKTDCGYDEETCDFVLVDWSFIRMKVVQ